MKKILFILTPIIVVLVFILLTRVNKSSDVKTSTEGSLSNFQNAEGSGWVSESQSKDRYRTYKQSSLEEDVDKKRVLYFYANWCSTCRPVDGEFNRRESEIPEDVIIIRINYNDSDTDDAERALANKYAITYQHTFVEIDENGEVTKKWNGGGLSELLENLN